MKRLARIAIVALPLTMLAAAPAYAEVKTRDKTQVKFEGMLGRFYNFFGGKSAKEGVEGKTAVGTCILLAQFFLWFYNGPVNTVIVNSVPAALRARAFAISILTIHLLGDAISPPIIGALSDSGGGGRLPMALLLVPAAMAVGCVIWLLGWRRLAEPAEAA